MPTQIFVVAHTHWDREWYHPAERFRQRLVPLVDELLDDPPAVNTSFLLDGQAVLLDDYLTVRPERAAELSTLLRDGRIEAGPWYVLADELIPSGEALVRNLLAGREVVRRLRGEPPPVLYCPDSFGHPAILPELAQGFGCSLVVLWRGYGGARWPAGDTVRWRGPSGAEVVVYHLPPDGYEYGSSLPTRAHEAEQRWAAMATVLLPRAVTGVALLLNGADHHARQRDQALAVSLLAAAAKPVEIVSSSLRAAAEAIVSAASNRKVGAVTGELRDSYGYTWTLGGTLATRAAQKRRNALAERALVRDVEPWLALTNDGGAAGTRALLRATWRDLLRAHPHDTLCGTSIDAVAAAFDMRLAVVEAQVKGLQDDVLKSLAQYDADLARRQPATWRPALLLRNPVARTRSGVAEVTVSTKIADVAVGPGSGARQGRHTEPDATWLARTCAQVLSRTHRVALTESARAYPDSDLVEETRALVWVDDIGGYVLDGRPLVTLGAQTPPSPVRTSDATIDNGLLRVTVDASGRVRLDELVSGRTVDRLLDVELRRDAGDLYTPAIREALEGMRFYSFSRSADGPLRGELTLQYVDDEGPGALTIRLALDAGLPALRISVDGTNAREDARLRLVIRGDASGAASTIADAAFHVAERTLLGISEAESEAEMVVRTAPLHRFVSRYASRGGMTLFSDGLAEYQSLPNGGVAVTLLRAVGELSRHDLPERPGHAGWPAPTPAAQSAGPYSARFAVSLHGADTREQREAVEQLADDVLLPITGDTLRSCLTGAFVAGGLELEGDGLAFSAAMPAQQAGWIVLRCVNRRNVAVNGAWRMRRPITEARRARLDETLGESLAVNDGSITFEAAPMEIVTILVRSTT